MSLRDSARKVTDQLSYNLLYAPDYPEEDRTSLEREEGLITTWVSELLSAVRREDIGDWIRLGDSKVTDAFENFRVGDETQARKDIEAAIQYIRNAVSKKPHRVDFVVEPGGEIHEAPD